MEYTITIQPSGHSFPAHKKESVLEAGLRAGKNLKYQCDNGSCGGCKVRLVSGKVSRMQSSEYNLSGADKDIGYFLPCVCEAKSDLLIEAAEFSSVTDVPYQEITARVRKIDIIKEGVIILRLRTPRTNTLRFLAGQSVKIQLPDGSARILQVASCPCNGMVLEFHVRCTEGDSFSEFLFYNLNLNDEVTVKGPTGEFILDEESQRPLIFIAYDTGFAGVKSLIEHAIALDMQQDIYLYRIACNPGQDYMHNVCRAWADAIDNLHYYPFEHCIPIDCNDEKKEKVCGQFLSVLEKEGEVSITDSDVYLSGIEDMVANLGGRLIQLGLPGERLRAQRVD